MSVEGLKKWLEDSRTSSHNSSNNENKEDVENLVKLRPSLGHKPTTFDRLENNARPLS